jgi:hypothetical protein
MLNGDDNNAISAFDDAIALQADFALAHYAKAVAYAHKDDVTKLVESLIKAVKADTSLKEVAINDLEFQDYASNAAFTAALQ